MQNKSLVTLIRPPALTTSWVPAILATPPLAHAYLAGTLAREGYSVSVIDAVGEAIDKKTRYDDHFSLFGLTLIEIVERIDPDSFLVGISSMFSQEWPIIKELIRLIRQRFPAMTIICGGEHVTAEPLYSLESSPELDCCVLGEGEETLVELARRLEMKRSLDDLPGLAYRLGAAVVIGPKRERIRAIDSISWPLWDGIPLENYLARQSGFGVKRGRSIPMLVSRGCPFQCTFCSSPLMWTTRWSARDPLDVVREIEFYIQRYQIDNVDFYDLTAIIRKDWILAFANLLIERNIHITWQLPSGTRSEAIDQEVCEAMFRSGCKNVSYAPESGSPAVLKRIKKRIKLDRMIDSMKSAIRAGINVKTNMIIGFPGETHYEMWETLLFQMRCAVIGVHDTSLWLFSPYPGSELYNDLKAEGKIIFSDDYFLSLSVYSDYSNAVSWNPLMGPRMLKFYRLLGTALFYATSYIVRPLRIFRTVKNLWRGTHESRLETILDATIRRYLTTVKERD